MTITISISCDGCGETAETPSDSTAGVNEIEGVLEPGWVHATEYDHCPNCAADFGDEYGDE